MGKCGPDEQKSDIRPNEERVIWHWTEKPIVTRSSSTVNPAGLHEDN